MKQFLCIYPTVRNNMEVAMSLTSINICDDDNDERLNPSVFECMDYGTVEASAIDISDVMMLLMLKMIKNDPQLSEIKMNFSYFPKCMLCIGSNPSEISVADKDIQHILDDYDLLAILDSFEFDYLSYRNYFLLHKNDEDLKLKNMFLVNFDLYQKIEEECKTNRQFTNYIVSLIEEINIALDKINSNRYNLRTDLPDESASRFSRSFATNHYYIYHISSMEENSIMSLSHVKERLISIFKEITKFNLF